MDKIPLGLEWNPRTGRTGAAVTHDFRDGHMALFAPTGAGKGACVEIVYFLRALRHMSLLSIDPSGQNDAVCGEAVRAAGYETVPLNPFNLHAERYPDMADAGCNVLLGSDPSSPDFFEYFMNLGDAMISVEGDSQRFFPESARGLITWLCMFVRLAEGDKANLGTVRDLLTGDLAGVAREAVRCGHPRIASLAYKYQFEDQKSTREVIATAETQTRSLLSDQIRASLAKNGVGDFGALKDRRKAVFLILPGGTELENHGVWLRLIVICALNALYRRAGAGIPVLLMLSEFAQLGKLAPVRAAFGQARKYGVRVLPVLQDMPQLIDIYGVNGANSFIANSACVVSMAARDPATAEYLSNFSGRQGVAVPNASDDPHGAGTRVSIGAQEERVWSPDRIRELPKFHGLVWKAGSARPQPVYLPPYWKIPECSRARPDPFPHDGDDQLPKWSARKAVGLAAVVTVMFVVAVLAMYMLLA